MAKNAFNLPLFPQIQVVARTAAAGIVAKDVVRISTIGDGTLVGVDKALALSLANIDGSLGVLVEETDGGATPGNGDVVRVLLAGLVQGVANPNPDPAVGASVYVSDTGTLSLVAGTVSRVVGEVLSFAAGVSFDCMFNGLSGMGTGGPGGPAAPVDAPYLTDGAVAGLTAEKNIQALAATLSFIAGADVVPLAAQRQNLVSTANIFEVRDEVGSLMAAFQADGDLQFVRDLGLKHPNYTVREVAAGWEVQNAAGSTPLLRITTAGQVSVGDNAISWRTVEATTVGAGQTTVWSQTLADEEVWEFDITVLAKDAAGPPHTKRAGYKRVVRACRAGGGALLLGGPYVPVPDDETDAAWDVTVVVGGNDVRLQVNGGALDTVQWRAFVRTCRMG